MKCQCLSGYPYRWPALDEIQRSTANVRGVYAYICVYACSVEYRKYSQTEHIRERTRNMSKWFEYEKRKKKCIEDAW